MKYMIAALLIVISLAGNAVAQENTHFLTVLAYQWTATHKVMTFSWPGRINTSCNGSTHMSGNINMTGTRVSDSGNVNMSGDVSGTETTSNTCETTYTPPSNQSIDIQKPVVFILADTESSRMVLTCTRNVRWSQCIALTPGVFEARNNNGHFEVSTSKNGKTEWIKFNIVQQTAFSQQEQEQRSEALNRKMEATEPESVKKKLDSICSDFSATAMRFLRRHPDVVAASATSQRGTAPGRDLKGYLDTNNLDPCSDASWDQAYEALKPTGAFKLK